MRSKKLQVIVLLFSLFGISACGTGGADTAGIGGTGGVTVGETDDSGIGGTGGISANITDISSSGTITGFGSIYVNGIKFDTDLADIEVNENILDEPSLKLGMVVKVKGVVNIDGVTGTALEVEYEHDIVGPISNKPIVDPDNTIKSFEVMGIDVVVDKTGTVFHGDGVTKFDFSTISQNDYVDISGFFDQNNRLYATSIQLLPSEIVNSGIVVLFGKITDYNGVDRFNIDSFTIQIEATTDLSNLDGLALQNDMMVKVKGRIISPSTIEAKKIKLFDGNGSGYPDADKDKPDSDDDEEKEWKAVEGLITDLDLASHTCKVDGYLADFTNLVNELAGFPLKNNLRVEIAGFETTEDIIEVETIRGRGGNVEVHGIVTGIKEDEAAITVQIMDGQPIVVHTDIRTQMEDNVDDEDDMNFEELDIGDFLKIKAMVNLDGTITANRIKRDDFDNDTEYFLRGPVSSGNAATKEIVILDVTIATTDDTDFEVDDNDVHNPDEFFSVVKAGDIVACWDQRIKGALYGDGIADQLEIENQEDD